MQDWPTERSERSAIRWRYGVALGIVIAFGAIVRFVALSRFPPGLHFDEAIYGLLARDILHGARPVFFSAWTGREPLYMYLMAPIQAIVGINTMAVRLTSALIGFATLPLTYLLTRELFDRRVALMATGLVAINYWHLTVSRNGYPNVLIPPLEAASFYCLWRMYGIGVRNSRSEVAASSAPKASDTGPGHAPWEQSIYPLLWAALGGLFAGLVLYTYLAARFYPITLLAIAAYTLIVDRRRFVQQLPELALSIVVMVAVVAPLALHFIRHPNDFVERADQVLILTQAPNLAAGLRLFLSNVWRTSQAFFVRGDPRWHYNLPGKPIFDPLLAVFFVAGVIVALRRRRELPYAAVLIWTAVMCLPGVLTADLQPAGQRMFGVFPALAMLPALGLDAGWRWTRQDRPRFLPLALAALALLFAWEGFDTAQTYFGDWVRRRHTYEIFNGDYAAMAETARREMRAGHTVVFVSEHYKHPTLAYLAPETMSDAIWTMGKRGLAFPSRGSEETVYLVPREPFPPGERVDQRLKERADTVEIVRDFSSRPAFTVYRVRAEPEPAVDGPTFNDEAQLLDAQWPRSAPRGVPLPITVRWQVLQAVPRARTFALHLVDDRGLRWAQTDEMSYLSEQWHAGDLVEQWFTLPLDPTAPAGTYTLKLALTDEEAHPLRVLEPDGAPSGLWVNLGEISLAVAGGRVEDVRRGSEISPALQALDRDRLQGPVSPGKQLILSVLWQKTGSSHEDRPLQIEFVDDAGRAWHSLERPIARGYPPTQWQIGEIVRGQYAVAVPADAPGGQSTVRLRLDEGTLLLGQIDVQAEGRRFTVPEVQAPLRATFGDSIRFLGYDLPRTEFSPGTIVPLTLYWQALQPIEGNYKVFTHLLDASGRVRGQKDSVPADGARPTTGWVEGEVIADEYEIPLPSDAPPGSYQIEVGLYDAATIERLPGVDGSGEPLPESRLLLPAEVQVSP